MNTLTASKGFEQAMHALTHKTPALTSPLRQNVGIHSTGQKTGTEQAQQKAAAAAKEFEAVFLSEMLSHMFSGIATDPVFGGGRGEDIYRSMMVSEYGKAISAGGGIGIADEVMKTILAMQGGS